MTKEAVHPGTPQQLVPTVLRKVNYRIYSVKCKGNKLIKQYIKTTEGSEIVKEVSVNPAYVDEYRNTHAVQYLPDTKNVNVEYYPYPISSSLKEKLEQMKSVVVIDTPRNDDDSFNNYNKFADLAKLYNDDPE
jgi:hypothetical protein